MKVLLILHTKFQQNILSSFEKMDLNARVDLYFFKTVDFCLACLISPMLQIRWYRDIVLFLLSSCIFVFYAYVLGISVSRFTVYKIVH